VGTLATHVWTPRYESGDVAIANDGDIGHADWLSYVSDSFYPCTPEEIRAKALSWEGIRRCQQSKPGTDISVAVIGDSHAEHLFLGLAEALPAENIVYYILNDALLMTNQDAARIVRHVASSNIKTVVVSEFWSLRGVRDSGLSATLETLSLAGKTIFVTDDVPYFSFEPFGCKYRKALLLPTDCSMDAQRFQRDYSLFYPTLLATVRQVPRAHMLNTSRYFCGEATCDMTRDGHLLYRDRGHLNINGSRFLAEQIVDDYPAFVAAVTRAH
jgi:hypothetical protein